MGKWNGHKFAGFAQRRRKRLIKASFVQDGVTMSQDRMTFVHRGRRKSGDLPIFVRAAILVFQHYALTARYSNCFWFQNASFWPVPAHHLAVVTDLDICSSRLDRILDDTRPADCIGIVLRVDALHQTRVDSCRSGQSVSEVTDSDGKESTTLDDRLSFGIT